MTSPYLDLDVSHFGCGADDGPPNKRREDVLWEVGACIAALDKLQEPENEQTGDGITKHSKVLQTYAAKQNVPS